MINPNTSLSFCASMFRYNVKQWAKEGKGGREGGRGVNTNIMPYTVKVLCKAMTAGLYKPLPAASHCIAATRYKYGKCNCPSTRVKWLWLCKLLAFSTLEPLSFALCSGQPTS